MNGFLQDKLPREVVAAEQAEIREALKTLDGAIDAAEEGAAAQADELPEPDRSLTGLEATARTDEEPVFPKASELRWREETLDGTLDVATSAEPASDPGRVQGTGLAQLHPTAEQVHLHRGSSNRQPDSPSLVHALAGWHLCPQLLCFCSSS